MNARDRLLYAAWCEAWQARGTDRQRAAIDRFIYLHSTWPLIEYEHEIRQASREMTLANAREAARAWDTEGSGRFPRARVGVPGGAHVRARPARPARPALFDGFWRGEDGHRLGRVSRDELREAHRLWRVHADVRERRAL